MTDPKILAPDEDDNTDECEPTEVPASDADAQRWRERETAITSEGPIDAVLTRLVELLESELEIEAAALAQREASADGEVEDDGFLGLSPVASARSAHLDLVRRLHACVVAPWKVRPAHAAKLLRWQRLRILDELGGLTGCWVGKPPRRCSLADKRHRGCRDRKNLSANACRRGELLILTQDIGGMHYYESFRPVAGPDGSLVAPPEWPSGHSPVARAMVSALWERYRSRRDTKCGDHERGRSPKDPPAHRVRSTGAESGTAVERSGRALGEDSRMASWDCVPFHDRHTCTRDASVKARVSPALASLRGELNDQAVYLCSLLGQRSTAKPDTKQARNEQAEGWRPITRAVIDRELGKFRRGGKIVRHSDELLGSRTSPGLLERLGVIERLSDYSAKGPAGYSQRYRLTDTYRPRKGEALVEVEVVLRKRAKTLPPKRVRAGAPVHPWLVECYPGLALDKDTALRELCASLGVPESTDLAVVLAGIDAMTGPTVRLTSKGQPYKKQDKDPREAARNHAKAIAGFDSSLALRRDHKVGRLVSGINPLPSWVSRHLTLAGSPVATLDIRSCGLALRAGEMRKAGADKDRDCAAVCALIEDPERDPYCALFAVAYGREPTAAEREAFKPTVLKDLYYSTPGAQVKTPLGMSVAHAYPGFSRYLVETKQARGDKGNGELAMDTLRMESALMLEALPTAFAGEGIRMATKHDCVYVRREELDHAAAVFKRVLLAAGIRAVVKA